jgi:acyl carrier protein
VEKAGRIIASFVPSTDTFEQVRSRLARQLKVPAETITADQRLDALGIDSLAALDLIFDLEQDFGISIPNERVGELATVADVCQAIDALRPSGDASG